MNTLEGLQKRFGDPHIIFEQSQCGIILMRIDHPLATATISLQGGQVLEWQPKSQCQPVLWSADVAHWSKGRAIRAGVPICWPWFGQHPTELAAPSHGYARVRPWTITGVFSDSSKPIEIMMEMATAHQVTALHTSRTPPTIDATLTAHVSIGETLSIDLVTVNRSDQPIHITEALHAYFNVSDIRNAQVDGLTDCDYVDLIDQNIRKTQHGVVQFSGETGRVYLNTKSDCRLFDPAYKRTIKIKKSGSSSTVLWNPWLETASNMEDLGPMQWQKMVCIESANALNDTVRIEAGRQHTLSVNYEVER